MSDNPFANVDWDSVPDDPFSVPEGQYVAHVSDVEYRSHKKGESIIFTYEVIEPDEFAGRRISEWKSLPNGDGTTPEDRSRLSWIKQRLLSLNVPSERIATFTPDDVLNLRVSVGVKQNGEYKNVRSVVVVDEDFSLDEVPF